MRIEEQVEENKLCLGRKRISCRETDIHPSEVSQVTLSRVSGKNRLEKKKKKKKERVTKKVKNC
jgi:hypothetical protein